MKKVKLTKTGKWVVFCAVLLVVAALLLPLLIRQIKSPYHIQKSLQSWVKPDTVVYHAPKIRYAAEFNDLQPKQIRAAREFGLKECPADHKAVESMKKELEQVRTCRYYVVEELSHSVPYLRPNSADELERIGRRFMELLEEKGLPQYRIIVTSLLRTKEDVKKLRKSNVNATSDSAHCYGTTFDIWYVKFDRISYKQHMEPYELRKVLAEVLREERDAGRIYVKYESKQHCFHITCRC